MNKQILAKGQNTLVIAVGSARVTLIASGDRICSHLVSGKTFEIDSLKRWGAICQIGGTVLDIGAYTGLFSIGAALLGCIVHAFEPMDFNAERLYKNAILNDVYIDIHRCVISEINDVRQITYRPHVIFTSGASLVRKKGSKIDIESRTIDSLNLQQCTAIKIDVERAEHLVLAGAKDTLARLHPALLVEALDEDRREAILAEVPEYVVTETLDIRNLLLMPR